MQSFAAHVAQPSERSHELRQSPRCPQLLRARLTMMSCCVGNTVVLEGRPAAMMNCRAVRLLQQEEQQPFDLSLSD